MESPHDDAQSPHGGGALSAPDLLSGELQRAAGGLLAPAKVARHPLLVSALLVGSLALGVLAALTPRYETNDDAWMNGIAAGRNVVDSPDEHLLFSNVLIGRGLKSLYQFAPHIPWYGSYLFATGCLSLLAICFVCLRQNLSEWTIGLTAAFLWVAGIPTLNQLQFTRIAFLAGLAGILLLASTVRVPGTVVSRWFAIPLLAVSGLIRFNGLWLVCVVLSPVIAWMLWRARLQKSARVAILILVACLTFSFGAQRFNEWYYSRDVAWQNYYPFSVLRFEFVDFGHVEYNAKTAPAFAAAGWQPIDLLMMRNRAFLDRERFSNQSLQTILDVLPSSDWKPPRPWQAFVARFAGDGELWGLLAFGAVCLAILAIDRAARYLPLACYAVTGVTCFLLYQQKHLPPRVYCPAVSGCAIVAIVFAAGPRSFGKRRAWADSAFGRRVALIVVGALVVWRAAAIWRSNANFLSFHKDAVEMMKELAPKPNQLFVVWAGDLPLEYLMLPLQSRSLPPDFKTLDLDWTYGFSKRRMEQFSVTDLMSIVRRGDGTFFVCRKDQMELMSAYVRAHFGVDLKYRVAFAHHALYDNIIYQVSVAGATPRAP